MYAFLLHLLIMCACVYTEKLSICASSVRQSCLLYLLQEINADFYSVIFLKWCHCNTNFVWELQEIMLQMISLCWIFRFKW